MHPVSWQNVPVTAWILKKGNILLSLNPDLSHIYFCPLVERCTPEILLNVNYLYSAYCHSNWFYKSPDKTQTSSFFFFFFQKERQTFFFPIDVNPFCYWINFYGSHRSITCKDSVLKTPEFKQSVFDISRLCNDQGFARLIFLIEAVQQHK